MEINSSSAFEAYNKGYNNVLIGIHNSEPWAVPQFDPSF